MSAPPPRLLVAAPARGSGKSTLAVGLAAALRARGLAVQPFKKGPDFIDPMWLAAASGRPCRNLDHFLMGPAGIGARFARHAAGADLALVEANHALHDGTDPGGADSGGGLARQLGLPVLLVVGTVGIGRGVAPIVLGQAAFDPAVRFAGVVLNRVRGRRHEAKLRDAVGRFCGLPVLGAVPQLPELAIAERHLGLTPLAEAPGLAPVVGALAAAVARHVDLDLVLAAAAAAPEAEAGTGGGPPSPSPLPSREGGESSREGEQAPRVPPSRRVRIGVAMDRAFTFYYPENLEALVAAGAELVPFSPLDDPRLPPVDGLYLGGGFPEHFMERLEANASLRGDVRAAIAAGTPVWAECGGLLYLCGELRWRGRRARMAGVFPGAAELSDRPAGHGYVELEATGAVPWLPAGLRLRGHEFHHSRLEDPAPGAVHAFRTLRGAGTAPGFDGLVAGNCVAGYTHLHADGAPGWAPGFVGFVRARAARG